MKGQNKRKKAPHDDKTESNLFYPSYGAWEVYSERTPDTLSLSADVQLNAAPLTRYELFNLFGCLNLSVMSVITAFSVRRRIRSMKVC